MENNEKETLEEERETKDLNVDESLLSEEDKEEYHRHDFPLWLIIVMGVIVLLMIACIIVIANL